MLRFYILLTALAVVVLMMTDPVKGFGIVAGLALIFGIPLALSNWRDKARSEKD